MENPISKLILQYRHVKRVRDLKRLWLYLGNAQFEHLFRGRELDNFYGFVRDHAMPAGGFSLSFELSNGSLAWIFYSISGAQEYGKGIQLNIRERNVFIPTDETMYRDIPEEIKH